MQCEKTEKVKAYFHNSEPNCLAAASLRRRMMTEQICRPRQFPSGFETGIFSGTGKFRIFNIGEVKMEVADGFQQQLI